MNFLEIAASSRIGGVETYLLRLTEHLQNRGHRVVFVTRRGVPLGEELRARGIPNHEWFRGGKNLFTVYRLARLIRRERIDLVHTHIFSANSLGALAAKIAGVPSVARVPATESAAHYARSTYVTAVSREVARHLESQGFPSQRLRVFYNGVDWRHFEQLPAKTDARRALNLPADAFVVVCAASLTARKGQTFLLQAAASLPPETHVLLCGEGREETALRALVTELHLENRVHFAGFTRDIRPALAAADAFALPSLLEGLPNVVLEALAAGVPTVATRIAGTPEIIEDGQNGFLVEPENAEVLVQALQNLRENPDLRAEFAHRGLETVRSKFDGERCLEEVSAFLEAAVEAWRNGRSLLPPSEARL